MRYKKQSGAVLIISLIILIALTLFVLSGSQTVVIQEKMTSAVRDLHVSLAIAESGIKDVEVVIEGLSDTTDFSDAGSGGLYSEGNGPTDLFADATWADSVTSVATTSVSGEVARYFIEDLGEMSVGSDDTSLSIGGYGESSDASELQIFKIVSRSTGISGNTERVVVSYYAKDF